MCGSRAMYQGRSTQKEGADNYAKGSLLKGADKFTYPSSSDPLLLNHFLFYQTIPNSSSPDPLLLNHFPAYTNRKSLAQVLYQYHHSN